MINGDTCPRPTTGAGDLLRGLAAWLADHVRPPVTEAQRPEERAWCLCTLARLRLLLGDGGGALGAAQRAVQCLPAAPTGDARGPGELWAEAWAVLGAAAFFARLRGPPPATMGLPPPDPSRPGLDEGLPSLSLSNLLYTENPYSHRKFQ
jgi:hypothetical protein